MAKVFYLNWDETDRSFKKYCLDFFDEKPVNVSELIIMPEIKLSRPKLRVNGILIFEKLLHAILKLIFVKIYDTKADLVDVADELQKQMVNNIHAFKSKIRKRLLKVKRLVASNYLFFNKNADIRLGFT